MLTMSLIVVGTSLPCQLLMSPCVVFSGKNLHHDDIKKKKLEYYVIEMCFLT
jgi:hypothetical protein